MQSLLISLIINICLVAGKSFSKTLKKDYTNVGKKFVFMPGRNQGWMDVGGEADSYDSLSGLGQHGSPRSHR